MTEFSHPSKPTEEAPETRSRSKNSRAIPWPYVVGAILLFAFIGIIAWLGRAEDEKEAQKVAEGRIPGEGSITIEVINASGATGLAQRYADHLRARGFDVVDFGTDRTKVIEKTYIFDRSGKNNAARSLAQSLGLSKDRVLNRPEKKLLLDLTLTLGKDAVEPAEIHPTEWRNDE